MDKLWIWIALGALLACAVGLLLVYLLAILPMKKLKKLTDRLEELETEELRLQAERISGTPGKMARASAS